MRTCKYYKGDPITIIAKDLNIILCSVHRMLDLFLYFLAAKIHRKKWEGQSGVYTGRRGNNDNLSRGVLEITHISMGHTLERCCLLLLHE